MQFNSLVFVGFFIVVFAGYLLLGRRLRAQNLWLLVASYVFYGYWDWRFLGLLAISTVVDWTVACRLDEMAAPRSRRVLLLASIAVNLGILGFFKYFNFFAESAVVVLRGLGMEPSFTTLNIVLPVGISFYTFQTMSYTIDVYRRRLPATRDLAQFALYVAFFPQLVAGPIERATNLLPQFQRLRRATWGQVDAGIWLLVWGYFKKVVIADNLAATATDAFSHPDWVSGLGVLLGVLAFTVQIYCDFSGYSDIARGLAKLMGFELMVNFRLPFFARSPADFWRRWHISLSTWLRDYLYIPLGGSRGTRLATTRNLVITMLLGGLWHGASWHFVLWGLYHGALLVLFRPFEHRIAAARGRWHDLWLVPLMLVLTVVGWIIFRVDSVPRIAEVFANLGWSTTPAALRALYACCFFSWPLFAVQYAQHRTGDLLVVLRLPVVVRAVLYGLLLVMISLFGLRDSSQFIYFQF